MVDESVKVENKSNFKLILWACIIFFVIEIVILSIAKANSPTFSTLSFIIWIGAGVLFFGAIAIGFFLMNRRKINKENEQEEISKKFPKPITFEECEEIVNKIFLHSKYSQYVSSPEKEGVESVGDFPNTSYVYHCIVTGCFKDKLTGERPRYGIIINLHYPDTLRKIIMNPTDADMRTSINKLACAPIKAPDREIIREKSALTGIERETEKITHQKDKKEVKKEEENLV